MWHFRRLAGHARIGRQRFGSVSFGRGGAFPAGDTGMADSSVRCHYICSDQRNRISIRKKGYGQFGHRYHIGKRNRERKAVFPNPSERQQNGNLIPAELQVHFQRLKNKRFRRADHLPRSHVVHRTGLPGKNSGIISGRYEGNVLFEWGVRADHAAF